MKEQELINQWFREYYDITNDYIFFVGYESIPGTSMGTAKMFRSHTTPEKRYTKIVLSNRLTNEFAIESVLWHEFSHGMEWYDYGTSSHGKRWLHYYLNKPMYVLGELVAMFNYITSGGRKQ